MKALVWHGRHNFKVEDIPQPKAEQGRIVVKVEAAAVCGSDFHADDFGAIPPLVLGHEVAGIVFEIGEGVQGFTIGDRVTLDPLQYCRKCWCCVNGIKHLCENFRHLGNDSIQGGWAEYVAIDAANAYPIPGNIDFASACLTEPVTVCYESFQRSGLKGGDTVLIIGDGSFGFLHAQVAMVLGASKIIIAGHHHKRLARIATATNAVTCNTRHQTLSDVLAEEIGSPGIDIVIEASGAEASPNIGLKALRPRGTIVIFSYIWKPEPLDMGLIHMRELNILGSCRSLNVYKDCLELMQKDKVKTSLLVDLKIPLEDYQEAIDNMLNHKEKTFKVVFVPS